MSDKKTDRSFLKISSFVSIVVLLLLLGITAFLAVQNRKMRQKLAATSQPVVAATPRPVPPEAGVVPVPTKPAPPATKMPAPGAASKKPATPTTAKRNYTQPEQNVPPSAAAKSDAETAPIARVEPTDVIPAEPMPYPRSEPQLPPQPAKLTATVPAGSVLTVRLLDTLNTERNQAGDLFRASLQEPIISDGNVVVPRGTTVEGRVVDAQQAGRVKGVAEMTLELSQLRLANGGTVVLNTGTVRREGETSVGEDTTKVGTGAAIGAVIGAISGGGKGAAVGAATGAGAGTAGVLLTRGKPLILSQETVLSFPLNAPATVTYTPGQTDEANTVVPADPRRRAPQQDDWDRDRPILRRRR